MNRDITIRLKEEVPKFFRASELMLNGHDDCEQLMYKTMVLAADLPKDDKHYIELTNALRQSVLLLRRIARMKKGKRKRSRLSKELFIWLEKVKYIISCIPELK